MSYASLGQVSADTTDLDAWRRDLGLANEAQIPVTALRSIRSVESGSNPAAIRFEPHLFWRARKGLPVGATGAQIRAAMTAADMAAVPYTPGNTSWRAANGLEPCRIDRSASCTGSETNRSAFNRAFAIDPAVAVRSTSWGSYQVLGGHLLSIWSDPARAVREFDANPMIVGERLLASWMRANPRAQAAARDLNWAELAHRYNGCSDCTAYVTRLRQAYDRWGPEWESVRAAVEAAGALAVSTATHNPMTTILLGITVLGAGGAFAWWAYRRQMKRNRRRRGSRRRPTRNAVAKPVTVYAIGSDGTAKEVGVARGRAQFVKLVKSVPSTSRFEVRGYDDALRDIGYYGIDMHVGTARVRGVPLAPPSPRGR